MIFKKLPKNITKLILISLWKRPQKKNVEKLTMILFENKENTDDPGTLAF